MSDNSDTSQVALRISQLDAAELDNELYSVVKSHFKNIFKYFKSNWLHEYDPECSAIIKFILWKYTIYDVSRTSGQTLLDLKYKNEVEMQPWMSNKQKILYAMLYICAPWLSQRSQTFSSLCSENTFLDQFWKLFGKLELFWKIAALIHFLVFLLKGRYQFITERLLGIRSVFPRPQGVRQVGFEYMERELLWHGFAEFLFFVLPLVNFRRIKNFMTQKFLIQKTTNDVIERCPADLKECVFCGEWPFYPQEIGCRHVFCYYCIYANFKADPSLCCPICGKSVESSNNIQCVKIKVSESEARKKLQF